MYLDTSVLGHWILYYQSPQKDIMEKASRNARRSLMLLDQLKKGMFNCSFESGSFAIAELLQVIRDDIATAKMKADALSLVYFKELRDFYSLDKEEMEDAYIYMENFLGYLRKLSIEFYETQIVPEAIGILSLGCGIDTSDAIHLSYASGWCDYFVTGDMRLLKAKIQIQKVIENLKIIPASGVHVQRELRK